MTDVLHGIVYPLLTNPKRSGAGYMARCPVHDDSTASLSVSPGRDHPVLFRCHAGCDTRDIIEKLGVPWSALMNPDAPTAPRDDRDAWTPAGPAVAVYDYRDETGRLLFQVCRTAAKDFRQRIPDPTARSGWTWQLGDTRRVIYRLAEVIQAVRDGRMIYICEGEKDVHTLAAQGLVATCNPGGAGKWRPEYAQVFRDAVVIIVADRDAPGQAHARQIRDSLLDVAASITIVEAADGKDATDHITAGRKLSELVTLWTNDEPAKPDLAPDLWEFIAVADEPYNWLVPDLLERGDRAMVTGFEGLGKSFLVRQMAVTLAAGVHPFVPHRSIDPAKVLVIDCENSERQSRRKFRDLAAVTIKRGCRPAEGALRIIHRPEGIDLTKGPDAEWLMERVTAHQPDALFIGPFYRLHNANINEELPARKTVAVLDAVRTAVDCAMIIEAHAGHGEPGRTRSVRPTGSSLLLRWPEFGFGLAPCGDPEPGRPCMDVEIRHWRGQRDQREWPAYLTWGDPGDWPWRTSLGPPAKLRAA